MQNKHACSVRITANEMFLSDKRPTPGYSSRIARHGEGGAKPATYDCLGQSLIVWCMVCSVEEVFEWILEVLDSDAVRDDTGRLAFTIEYDLASAGALRGHVENKVATRVQIQPDTTFAIVPVVKVSSVTYTLRRYIYIQLTILLNQRLDKIWSKQAVFCDYRKLIVMASGTIVLI